MNGQTVSSSIPWTLGLVFVVAAIGGCGGSDSDSDPPNQAPVADAGSNTTVAEFTTVILDGSGTTDPNGMVNLEYQWTLQTAGSSLITLSNADAEQASFTAPDVEFGSPQQFTFRLTVTDSDGASDSDSVTITVQHPGPDVVLTGTAEYEFVPTNNNCQGLAFPSTQPRLIRGATLQVIDANDPSDIITEAILDDNGEYSVMIPSQMEVFLRVRAELKRAGLPGWDVEVRDNTSNTGVALGQRPLYVLDTEVFDSGTVDSIYDILAETGWNSGTNTYTDPRAAAPFSILDTIYNGIQLVLSADDDAFFEPLDAFWSVNNTLGNNSQNSSGDINDGQLTGSFYRGGDGVPGQLFLLGDASTDTEEFDINVIAHEWGHYFEDKFSRSDSRGGPHSLGNRLDMRLAFGEGWGTAVGAMATGIAQYCDTAAAGSTNGFGFNVEQEPAAEPGVKGWFNEVTIARLLYDLWDDNADGVDNDSLGSTPFSPIYSVMRGPQEETEALTSIFSFSAELKSNFPQYESFIDALLDNAKIDTTSNIYGNNASNDADGNDLLITNDDVIPIYHDVVPDSAAVNVCSNSQFDNNREGNKLSEYQYIRFEVPTGGNYRLTVLNSDPWDDPPQGFNCRQAYEANPNDPEVHRYSDPDFLVYQNGNPVAGGADCTPNIESDLAFLNGGTHIIALTEYRFADDQTVGNHPPRACFDVSVTSQ